MTAYTNSHIRTRPRSHPTHTIQSATCADCGRAWRGPRAHSYADKHNNATNHYLWYGYETLQEHGVTTIHSSGSEEFEPIEPGASPGVDQFGWVDLISGNFEPQSYRFSRR